MSLLQVGQKTVTTTTSSSISTTAVSGSPSKSGPTTFQRSGGWASQLSALVNAWNKSS